VRSDEGAARVTLKHYYRQRLFDPDLWRKIARGRFNYRAAAGSLVRLVRTALRRPTPAGSGGGAAPPASLPERMLQAWQRYHGAVLLIMSGNDLTAREFDAVAASTPAWRALLAAPRVTRHELAPADHTFSRRAWRDQVAAWTATWVNAR
jgi:hypothetical protein